MSISYDTILAGSLLNEELPLNLLDMCAIELGVDNWGKGKQSFGDSDTPPSPLWGSDGMGAYCAKDTAYTHLLYESQRPKVVADQELARLLKYLVLPGAEALIQMELNGMWINTNRLKIRKAEMENTQKELISKMLEYVPEDFRERADFGNEHFLRRWIFGNKPDGLGLDPISWTEKTGLAQVDDKSMARLNHPAIAILREYKRNLKSLQFFDQWETLMDNNDRIHPFFNPTGTVTGRRSCDRPNLQQVPRDKRLRTCLGAPPGYVFLEVDYSMLEVRLAAWLAEEETMLQLFARDGDVYRYTASVIYKIPENEVTKQQRQGAKAVVLGFLYGMSASGFVSYARDIFGVQFTSEEAEEFRGTFFNTYPRFLMWHGRQKELANRFLQVKSPLGRIRHLMGVRSNDNYVKAKTERQAINSPVQGTGGDFTLAAMVSLMQAGMPKEECMQVGDVHDALLFQIREDVWEKWAYRILNAMELPEVIKVHFPDVKSPVRMKAEGKVGKYWGDGVEFSLTDFSLTKTSSSGELVEVKGISFEKPEVVSDLLRNEILEKIEKTNQEDSLLFNEI